ncbi:hypothetical protein KCP75_19970 [Salmonella enterica subsp. enterica]|nr:hypothetical protein KCP75_19970 [Salmonella enterica subsp. enterica]
MLAVGYRVFVPRAAHSSASGQTQTLQKYLIKGFRMDDT